MRGKNTLSDAVRLGRALSEQADLSRLEAFSGNAIYFSREMPTMNKYKTVKELCALTGLTRKHLYYFHHEGVVRAVAYANYSVEGYDGYKLYDDAAVEKLQQISLYYQLGLKRDEIKKIMLAPDYDSNAVLHTLLAVEWEKKLHIERNIAALEYLVLAGTKNSVSGVLRGIFWDNLGRALLEVRAASADGDMPPLKERGSAEAFTREFAALLAELAQVDEAALKTSAADAVIAKIFDVGSTYLGADSPAFILGLFMSVLGEGSIAQELARQLKPVHGRAVIQYMIDHPELFGQKAHAPSREN